MQNGSVDSERCRRCSCSIDDDSGFFLAGQRFCFCCAIMQRTLLYRSAKTAAVVGTVLVIVNVGPAMIAGELSQSMMWKIPLNYIVPFCVATWGALSNSRSHRSR